MEELVLKDMAILKNEKQFRKEMLNCLERIADKLEKEIKNGQD